MAEERNDEEVLEGMVPEGTDASTEPTEEAAAPSTPSSKETWMKNMRAKMQKILLYSVAGCALIVAASPFIYKVWIGDRVDVPVLMTTMVAVYVAVYCWMNLNGTLVVGMGKVKLETILVIIGMCVHIPLALFLGHRIGAYGVITSLIAVNLMYAIFMQIQVDRILSKKAKGIWLE